MPIYDKRTFDIILDCTSFTSISEVPLQWLKYCAELIPADIRSRFMTTHILNPNALTQKYLRRLYNVTAGELIAHLCFWIFLINFLLGTPFCIAVRAYSSVAELLEEDLPRGILKQLPEAGQLTCAKSSLFGIHIFLSSKIRERG